MNAFTTTINASLNTPSEVKSCKPFDVEINTYMSELEYPEELHSLITTNKLDFSVIQFMANSYANRMGVFLYLKLTGYTDPNNYRFESNQFVYNNEYRKLLFIMENGIPNVISN